MPKLKRSYPTLEEIDETFRPLYKEEGGKFVLDKEIEFEGLVSATKLDEFRTTNTTLKKAHEQELEKYKEVDVDKYKDLLAREKDLEDGKLVKRGELADIRKSAVEEALQPWKQKEQTWETDKRDLTNRLTSSLLDSQVVAAALPMGLKKGATKDLLNRAREIFKLNDEGELQAFERDGQVKYHAGDPYTFDQFVKDTADSDDGKHLFEPNEGGGGQAQRGGSSFKRNANEINPWNPKTENHSLQGQILQQDRPKAIRMAKEFGVAIPETPFARA